MRRPEFDPICSLFIHRTFQVSLAMRSTARLIALMLGIFLGPLTSLVGQEAEAVRFFESKIRPVLVEHCYSCHGEKKQRSGLRVDGRSHLLQGGDLGPALVPGDPEKSRLIA